MATFKEIYNKRRTREIYTEDKQGNYRKNSDGEYYQDANPHYGIFIDYYKQEIKHDNYIVGTGLAFTTTLFEMMFNPKTVYGWFRGIITDGYALTLLSPFIWLYWILVTILYIPTIALFGSLVVIAYHGTVLWEMPASILNKEDLKDTCLYDNIAFIGIELGVVILPLLLTLLIDI